MDEFLGRLLQEAIASEQRPASLEALASGTPVLTTAANGASELLSAKPAAGQVLSDPGDVQALARALSERLALGVLGAAGEPAAREAVQGRTVARQHAQLEALLVELLGPK